MAILIWGTRAKSVDLGPAGSWPCPNCGQDRPFRNVLRYQLNHLYYVLGFVSRRKYLRVCEVCGRGEELQPSAVAAAGLPSPIPWLERFGCLGAAAAVAALILGAIGLSLLGPGPRDVPDLMDRARRGETAALERLRQEAEGGDVPSQEALSDLYLGAPGSQVARNDAEAFHWARAVAERGTAAAQHRVGWMYESGMGTARDYGEAMRWYRKAAAQGLAASANSVAALYLRGLGVPPNPQEAVRWFRQAAEGGDPGASFNLAMRYWQGQGVAADFGQARRWLERAVAATGTDDQTRSVVADANFELGVLYENGWGVQRDAVKALHAYEAAMSRNDEARQSFERLKAKLAAR